jgi:predicted AAA+ superfamily ATPase
MQQNDIFKLRKRTGGDIMITRQEYLNTLISFREKKVIKVVTGIRRCGKSTLFEIFQNYLLNNGAEKKQIIAVNLEDGDYNNIQTSQNLYTLICERLLPDKMNYVFLDEVQRVDSFQKAVDSLFIKPNVDLYITGSNAYLLSGELATLLSGRYVEIKMLPLSFKEYLSFFHEQVDLSRKYMNYLTNSSFPGTLELERKQDIRMYLEGIYSSIVLKDIVSRRRIADISMLESVIRYMFDNIGNLCSATKIANTMTSAGRKIAVRTVESYLEALTDSFILYRADRYDVKGKQYLSVGAKYYLADIGLRYYLLGSRQVDFGHILENIVYLELLRRGYEVYVGKMGTSEVDFVAFNEEGIEYYQVSLSVMDEHTLQRELTPLDSISDHNPKYLLTMDPIPLMSHNGIRQIYVLDWLLEKSV